MEIWNYTMVCHRVTSKSKPLIESRYLQACCYCLTRNKSGSADCLDFFLFILCVHFSLFFLSLSFFACFLVSLLVSSHLSVLSSIPLVSLSPHLSPSNIYHSCLCVCLSPCLIPLPVLPSCLPPHLPLLSSCFFVFLSHLFVWYLCLAFYLSVSLPCLPLLYPCLPVWSSCQFASLSPSCLPVSLSCLPISWYIAVLVFSSGLPVSISCLPI